jgi:hypothetical protein
MLIGGPDETHSRALTPSGDPELRGRIAADRFAPLGQSTQSKALAHIKAGPGKALIDMEQDAYALSGADLWNWREVSCFQPKS